MGKLTRLTESLHNTPLLITDEYLRSVVSYLDERNENPHLGIKGGRKRDKEDLAYDDEKQVGVLSVSGPLTYMEYEPMCGEAPTSYQKLEAEAAAMIAAGAKTILMDVDSPGGEAYSAFESAKNVRQMADDAGVELIAYVDGLAASAGYVWASVAHQVVMNPMAEVGSIGVVVRLRNDAEKRKKEGIEDSYIYAGESKIPFDEDGKFTQEFKDELQSKVDALYVAFIRHVAEMRNMSEEAVRNTKAKTFQQDKAMSLGLVDAVMERNEFFTYLSDIVNTGNTMSLKDKLFNFKKSEGVEVATLQDTLPEVQAKMDEQAQLIATLSAEKQEVISQLTSFKEQYAALEKQVAEMLAEKEAVALAAKQAKATARKEQLTAVLGDAQGEKMFAQFGEVEDEAFELLVSNFKQKLVDEKQTPAFKEMGVGGDSGKDKVEAKDPTRRILEEKYKQN